MSVFSRIADKLREDKKLRNRLILGTVLVLAGGTGAFVIRRGGYKKGYARGFEDGEATASIPMLEGEDE